MTDKSARSRVSVSSLINRKDSRKSSTSSNGSSASTAKSESSLKSDTSTTSKGSKFSVDIPEEKLWGSDAYLNEDVGAMYYGCRDPYHRKITGARLADNGKALEVMSGSRAFHSKLFINAKDQKVFLDLAHTLRQAKTRQDLVDAAIEAFKDEYPAFVEDARCLLIHKPKGTEHGFGANKFTEWSRPTIERTVTGKIPFTQAYGAHYPKKTVRIASMREGERAVRGYIINFQFVLVCADGKEFENFDFHDRTDQMRLQHLGLTDRHKVDQAFEQFKRRYAIEYNDKGYLKLVKP